MQKDATIHSTYRNNNNEAHSFRNNKVLTRQREIKRFCTELKNYDVYSSSINFKRKKEKDKKALLEISEFIAFKPVFKDTKIFPVKSIRENFRVSTRFLRKHKEYIIAVAILKGPSYSELNHYFNEESE